MTFPGLIEDYPDGVGVNIFYYILPLHVDVCVTRKKLLDLHMTFMLCFVYCIIRMIVFTGLSPYTHVTALSCELAWGSMPTPTI